MLVLLFSDNLAVVFDFLTVHEKLSICTLQVNIKIICSHCETGNRLNNLTRGSHFFMFLKLIQINFVFSDNVLIISMQISNYHILSQL